MGSIETQISWQGKGFSVGQKFVIGILDATYKQYHTSCLLRIGSLKRYETISFRYNWYENCHLRLGHDMGLDRYSIAASALGGGGGWPTAKTVASQEGIEAILSLSFSLSLPLRRQHLEDGAEWKASEAKFAQLPGPSFRFLRENSANSPPPFFFRKLPHFFEWLKFWTFPFLL